MGVPGWTRFLSEQGWLPPRKRLEEIERGSNGGNSAASGMWRDPALTLLCENDHTGWTERLEVIPRDSVLHIDGYGLVYHLYDVCYARYLRALLGQSSLNLSTKTAIAQLISSNGNNSNPNTNGGSDSGDVVQSLFPIMMPLDVLDQVTREYMAALLDPQRQFAQVIVYFDGDARRRIHRNGDHIDKARLSKAETMQQRKRATRESWENQRLYCEHGLVPPPSKRTTNSVYATLIDQLPRPRLLAAQFRHTLLDLAALSSSSSSTSDHDHHLLQRLRIVECIEESDPVMARAATAKSNHYVLANDSDFCFFANLQYIPFSTFHVPHKEVMDEGVGSDDDDSESIEESSDGDEDEPATGVVIRRTDLAESLGLHDEDMVELTLLCGNDYLVNPFDMDPTLFVGCHPSRSVQDNVDFLVNWNLQTLLKTKNKNSSSGNTVFRVTSNDGHVQEILDFVRAQYNHLIEELSTLYPLVGGDDDEDDDDIPDDESFSSKSPILTVPSQVNLNLARQFDTASTTLVKDAVLQCLEDYVARVSNNVHPNGRHNQDEDVLDPILTKEHVHVFRTLSILHDPTNNRNHAKNLSTRIKNRNPLAARPQWSDIRAFNFIARVVSESFLFVQKKQLPSSDHAMTTTTTNKNVSPLSLLDYYQFHAALQTFQNSRTNIERKKTKKKTSSSSFHRRTDRPNQGVIITPATPAMLPPVDQDVKLPIDQHEKQIIEHIRKHRVTIIQAETGAGKSCRVPVMILNAPAPPELSLSFASSSSSSSARPVKLFISQPRRIAAKALVERLRSTTEPHLQDCFALRMGHGVREYESKHTRAWFVTAGYLVRLLAQYPHRMDDITHLIIDEVHERSVETDLLCLLCRRLLDTNPRIRLVLMSATLASTMYQTYFDVRDPPLKVGIRRFPVEEVFLDDLESSLTLPPKIKKNVETLLQNCSTLKCRNAPSPPYMESLYSVIAYVAMIVTKPGTSILVFVPGMNDIIAVTEEVEKLCVNGVTFTCLPIHSDIPFEDQLEAFQSPAADEVKVVVATNAAESSVTLPAVDVVICTGLCKQIVYNAASHRQMLVPTWISRASATQRAGRTGRLRPGTVYRLYTRENYTNHMIEFEPGEMSRMPLDSVILMLKTMVPDEAVTSLLLDCLEPPDVSTIDRSLQSLHRSHFTTTPDEDCDITTLGAFVAALGIDLALGSLIGLGIQMGVGKEAIQLAGVLSFPKTPWVMTNPLIHEPGEYNEKTKGSYVSRCQFDANLFSEPFAIMNMLYEFDRVKNKDNWCYSRFLVKSRVHRVSQSCKNISHRVADFFKIDESVLHVTQPPCEMPHSKLNVLRIIQVWVFFDSLIECQPPIKHQSMSPEGYFLSLEKTDTDLCEDHFKQVLSSERHPFQLKSISKTLQNWKFDASGGSYSPLLTLESRFVSYAVEKKLQLFVYWDEKAGLRVYVDPLLWKSEDFSCIKIKLGDPSPSVVVLGNAIGSRRGVGERACGQWSIQFEVKQKEPDAQSSSPHLWRVCASVSSSRECMQLMNKYMELRQPFLGMAIDARNSHEKSNHKCSVTSYGLPNGIFVDDLRDLLGVSNLKKVKPEMSFCEQMIVFPITDTTRPIELSDGDNKTSSTESSWLRPVLQDCIPEGARLLSILASGIRRKHVLRLQDPSNDENFVEVGIDKSKTKLSDRWKRMNTSKNVYVPDNCVPTTALPMDGKKYLYCVASNILEVRGGGLCVEGLTLLPSGRAFVLLARLSFGLFNDATHEDDDFVDKCMLWLRKDQSLEQIQGLAESMPTAIESALQFHQDSLALGEELFCFPHFVKMLVSLLDGVDGFKAPVWDIESDVFTKSNMSKWKRVYAETKNVPRSPALNQSRSSASRVVDPLQSQTTEVSTSVNGKSISSILERANSGRRKKINGHAQIEALSLLCHPSPNREKIHASTHANGVVAYTNGTNTTEEEFTREKELILDGQVQNQNSIMNTSCSSSELMNTERDSMEVTGVDLSSSKAFLRLFASDRQDGVGVDEFEFPSTNLLSLIVERARGTKLTAQDWSVSRIVLSNSESCIEGDPRNVVYLAAFLNQGLHYTTTAVLHGALYAPSWIVCGDVRPTNLNDAMLCVPEIFRETILPKSTVVRLGNDHFNDETVVLAFESIEIALRMESAFWLERQFNTSGEIHWHEQADVNQLILTLKEA